MNPSLFFSCLLLIIKGKLSKTRVRVPYGPRSVGFTKLAHLRRISLKYKEGELSLIRGKHGFNNGCAMLSTNHTSYTVLMIHGTISSNLKNLIRV